MCIRDRFLSAPVTDAQRQRDALLGALVGLARSTVNEPKTEAAKAEVHPLLEARFIDPISYPTWLANVLMVQIKSGSKLASKSFDFSIERLR